MILDADQVDARELEPFGRVEGEQVDTVRIGLDAFRGGERDALEQSANGLRQVVGLAGLDEGVEAGHRGGIALGGASLGPDPLHEPAAAQPRDQLL